VAPPGQADAVALKELEGIFKVEPPDATFEYFIDYALFHGNGPENFEHLSDEFDVPGFLADRKWYIEGNGLAETYSRPGYCTVTLLGVNGGWAMCPIVAGDGIDLARFQPPLEFETSFIAAEDTIPWHLWWTFNLFDDRGKNLGQGWGPGIQNVPGKGRAFINTFDFDPTRYAKTPDSQAPVHAHTDPRSRPPASGLQGGPGRSVDVFESARCPGRPGKEDRQDRLPLPGLDAGSQGGQGLGCGQFPELSAFPV